MYNYWKDRTDTRLLSRYVNPPELSIIDEARNDTHISTTKTT